MGMIINPYAFGAAYDADAQAFFTAAGITDNTQKTAVNQLVSDLKTYGIWTKMKALYPFVGGTSTTHSYNLKNTAQYQITWYGGVTHTANGIIGNGTNGYGDTFLANNLRGQNDNHHSVYVRNITFDGATGRSELSSWSSGFGNSIYAYGGGDGSVFLGYNNSTSSFTFTQASLGGLYLNKRISSTQMKLQRNSTIQTFSNTSTNNIAASFKILRTGDFNGEYSTKNIAFATIGDGLDDTESVNLYTAIQTFQTTLSRNV